MRNVEIKAKVKNLSDLIKRAKTISGDKGIVIKQHDTFYNVLQGRLKLRRLLETGEGQLIYYERPDSEGPKLCEYHMATVGKETCQDLENVLVRALGSKVHVNKSRILFLVDQTRVHVDTVEGLGYFLEQEVVLRDEQSLEEGQQIANRLMEELGVHKEDLLTEAYADMLVKQQHVD